MTKTAFCDPLPDPQNPLHDPRWAAFTARTAIKEYIAGETKRGKLRAIKKDPNVVVAKFARTSLAEALFLGTISRVMVERWVMEAIKNASNPSKPPQSN